MAGKSEDGVEPIVIKKYANRRLYNTEKSTYVTLDHLAEMVREGKDFVVKDAKTGNDITRSVLTQIIFEEESKGQNMLPVNFLRQLISLYGDTVQGLVPGYLDASMEAFAKNQDAVREQIESSFGDNPAMVNFDAITRKNMEWFESAMSMFSPYDADKPEPASEQTAKSDAEETPVTNSDVELGELKSQLAQMQEQLSKLVDKS